MKTKVWNGEYWYIDERPLLMRVRHWVIRIGGWERNPKRKAKSEWRIVRRSGLDKRLRIEDPTPVSLFGHLLTFQWFGVSWRRRKDYVCWNWRQTMGQRPGKGYAYVSRNATPWAAHYWLWGWHRYYNIDEENGPR